MTIYGTGMEIKFNQAERRSILARLKLVGNEVRRKSSLNALRKAADVLVTAARADALLVDDPATPSNISKNIVRSYSRRYFRQTGNQMYRIGVMGGAKDLTLAEQQKYNSNPGRSTFYWRFVNFGFTSARTGRPVPGKFFFGKQLAQQAQRITDVYTKTLDKELDKAIAKARRSK